MSNWAIGFTMGLMVVLAYQKIYDEPVIVDGNNAEELINAYKRGQADALRTNPVSMELEQSCLNIWASKQPVEK
jgi:hypothetical protein